MDFLMKDTIAAISTPPGEGGIGIVRVSGDLALEISQKIFRASSDLQKTPPIEPRKVLVGTIIEPDTAERLDEVILTFMKGPNSYTTQDVAEINCHGGPLVLKRVLQIVLSLGARIAEPGEFTKRAFLGGRIDLAQAEAVMDLIRSRTDEARRVAMFQMKGALSDSINRLYEDLVDFLMQLEVRIDFCEDDIPSLSPDFKEERIVKVLYEIDSILEGFEKGKIYREGVRACILGPPNVGKSTLLNSLLGEDRAIVTHLPGTTRDSIEETVNIQGIPIILIDTAGIRKSDDIVETLGIRRSLEAARRSDIYLLVLDGSAEFLPDLEEMIENLQRDKSIVIMNKIDVGRNYPRPLLEGIFPCNRIVEVSLKTGENLENLEKTIVNLVLGAGSGGASEIILSNARHRDALVRAQKSLTAAADSIRNFLADDFVTIDIKSALDSLGEITGRITSGDLLDRIFSTFCIGK